MVSIGPHLDLFFTGGWAVLGIVGLYISIQVFRNRISWGTARYMGIPIATFAWMNIIYWFVLFEGAYGFLSLVLDWPLWIDISLFCVILVLSLWVYFRLLHREKFKPNLFWTLFLIPLSIPGIHTAGKLIPRVAPIETVKPAKIIKSSAPFPQTVHVYGSGYQVEFLDSQSKGRLGDSLTARRLTAEGYTKETSKLDQVHGIDGVFVRYNTHGRPKKILVVENKVDKGRLTSHQMTDDWIKREVDKMLKNPEAKVRHTGRLIQKYRHLVHKELWHHDLRNGKTTISVLDGEANKSSFREEKYIGNQIKRRCQTGNPTISCFPITE